MADRDRLEQVIDTLVREVELAVHALYRGDVRQNTVKARTEGHRRTAVEALAGLVSAAPVGAGAPSNGAPSALAREELEAVTRCVMAWLPMGPPSSAAPESRCVAAGRELVPSWGDRERARAALKRLDG